MNYELQVFEEGVNPLRMRVEIRESLRLRFQVLDPESRVDFPEKDPDAPVWREALWKYSCFECFIQKDGAEGYLEVNFSPSGAFWYCWFDSYRKAAQKQARVDFDFEFNRKDKCLEALITLPTDGYYRIHPCVVLLLNSGRKTHWALSHQAGAPDFHKIPLNSPLINTQQY